MKRISFLCGVILCTTQAFSQGNSGGNANENNNANGTALKWDRQGNEIDTTDFIGTTNERDLKMRTNNEERLRITPDGKIGVGIMNPLEKFDINVPMRARQNFKLDGNLFVGGDAEFAGDVKIQGKLELVYLDTANTLEVTDIIVRGGDGVLKQFSTRDFTDLAYQPRTCSDDGIVYPIWHNGINKLYTHCPEVNVGISTTSPLVKLDVRGSARFTLGVGIGTTIVPGASLHITNPQGNNQMDVLLLVENDERRLLQLDNDGMLRAREIKVDLQQWPDYVFSKDYKLLSLNEVETYIQNNGHLPNVPSAEEMEKDGINLAETNKILMEKVEELTLYLIEQNKEIEQMKMQIEELQKP